MGSIRIELLKLLLFYPKLYSLILLIDETFRVQLTGSKDCLCCSDLTLFCLLNLLLKSL